MAKTTVTKAAKAGSSRMSDMALKEQRWGRLFVAAPFIGFCLFSAFPIVFAFVASLSNWTGTNSIFANFNGLSNYIELFTDSRFWMTVGTTIIYMIGIPVGIVTTGEKRYKGHRQRKVQTEGFFSRNASAKPRTIQWD